MDNHFMQETKITMNVQKNLKVAGGITSAIKPTSMGCTWMEVIRPLLMAWIGLIGMDIITHSKQQKWRSEDSRPMMLIYCVWSSVILDLFLDYLNKQYSNFCLFIIIKYKKISLTILKYIYVLYTICFKSISLFWNLLLFNQVKIKELTVYSCNTMFRWLVKMMSDPSNNI